LTNTGEKKEEKRKEKRRKKETLYSLIYWQKMTKIRII
jgi:hypothetical protein